MDTEIFLNKVLPLCTVNETQNGTHLEVRVTTDYVTKRGDWYLYRRRVPKYISHLDQRKEVKISLKTMSRKEAVVKATIYNDQIENYWRALLQSGETENAYSKYKAAVQLAKVHGFAYKTTEEITAATLNEIVDRLLVDLPLKQTAEAILGGTKKTDILLADCWELYRELVPDRLINKSDHQIKKWENPRKAAINNFIAVIGNKTLFTIARSDILSFRSWCNEKIKKGWSANTANRQLLFVKDILKTVSLNAEMEIGHVALFADTSFREKLNSRPPFEASFVQERLLRGLKGINTEHQMVLWALADTGARIKEIFGLIPEDIRIEDDIPFIWIRPRQGYSLKTITSERKIPLVGSALTAFKRFPDGFNGYGNPDTFSNTINKQLDTLKLRPTARHSIYSLRHTFKDRLRDIEAPEEIIDGLMGHKKPGPKYGRGHKLETKHKWLLKIAFKVQ